MLKIALPNKGRLSQDTKELFNDAGLEVRALSDRALTASLGGEFEAIFVRAQDIPEFISDGAADVGITGLDLISEANLPLDVRLDLGFGRCRLSVAAREDGKLKKLSDLPPNSRIATSFPNATRRFFEDAGIPVEVVRMSGAAEIAPHLGIADVIVDLVSTGSTLKTNGLSEIATILTSTAHLVCTKDRSGWGADREEALLELTTALDSVIKARGQRYLMANVPRDQLDRVKEIVPGINGPTVIDVMNGGRFVAVHSVVPAASIYKTINALKSLGGEGILVTRIERLMQ